HYTDAAHKVVLRAYTIRASGTKITPFALAQELLEMLIPYASGKSGLNQKQTVQAFNYARKFFGDKNTQTDGKYGELLLFALVESVLGCKMVAHKIKSLSNFNDQVKGGDGIFLGDYGVGELKNPAYLIGESKVMSGAPKAITEALSSINRFHDPITAAEFLSTELIVAREMVIENEGIALDELYERLNPQSEAFHRQNLVHPILIMYNHSQMVNLEQKAKNFAELEALIKIELEQKQASLQNYIKKKIGEYEHISKVYLDFFILPTSDVDAFRNAMYYEIHGQQFKAKS
ncbi:MAG: DUF1837 domain-containing protein, partial [Chryseobacterium sp.]